MSPAVGPDGVVEGAAHGTLTGYSTHGCRCTDCRAAKATYSRENRARKASAMPKPWPSAAEFQSHMKSWEEGYRRGQRDTMSLALSVLSSSPNKEAAAAMLKELRLMQAEEAT